MSETVVRLTTWPLIRGENEANYQTGSVCAMWPPGCALWVKLDCVTSIAFGDEPDNRDHGVMISLSSGIHWTVRKDAELDKILQHLGITILREGKES